MKDNEDIKSRTEMFEELVVDDPNDLLARYGLGSEYLKAKRYSEAERQFREALRIRPDYSAAYRELGKTLAFLEKTEEAKTVYQKGLQISEKAGDLQTKKEIEVFLKRLEKK